MRKLQKSLIVDVRMGSNYTSGILSPVPNNRNGGSREVPNKMVVGGGGGLKNVLGQKWLPVITNYGCPKQLLKVEKHQYNFSCSLHLSIKQNRTFLITNLTNVNTKSCLRNQTRLCIHFLVLLVSSH